MASLALSSLSRAPLRLSEFHCVTLRPIVASFSAKSRFSTIRQVHSNRARHVNRTAVVPKSLRSISTIPNASRYPQGPTPEGLRIVVQAMQRGPGQLQTRDIWELIHQESKDTESTFPSSPVRPVRPSTEPPYPDHYVRSMRYLKAVLLKTLEAHGRVRKFMMTRDPITPEEQAIVDAHKQRFESRNLKKAEQGLPSKGRWREGVDAWVWELVPVPPGTVPIEERDSMPINEHEIPWETRISENSHEQDKERGLELHQRSTARENDKAIGSKSWSIESSHTGDSKRLRSSSFQEELFASEEVRNADLVYGEKLEAKWKNLTKHSRRTIVRLKEIKNPVDWKDPGVKAEKSKRRREQRAMKLPTTTQSGLALISETDTSAPNTSSKDEAKPSSKPWLNPKEPEYRQSRRGANDVPIALRDPRRRMYGFNYGLPKQKELLRAANARDYDQKEWGWQPPHDISHLNRRRQRTREKQNIELTKDFKSKSRADHEARKGPSQVTT